MIEADRIRVSTRIDATPERVFALFTEDVDLWWKKGPRFRFRDAEHGSLCFEPGVGGRFLERGRDGEEFEIGRI